MEKDVSNYVRKHTLLVTMVVVTAFIALAFGEYVLYRKIMEVNQMVSEGLMQMKESQSDAGTTQQVVTIQPTVTQQLMKVK